MLLIFKKNSAAPIYQDICGYFLTNAIAFRDFDIYQRQGFIITHQLPADFPFDAYFEEVIEEQDYYFVDKKIKADASSFLIGTHSISRKHLSLIAGPCSIESQEQIMQIAKAVKSSGAHILRGGAFKPRSSCYRFQGLGIEGLNYLSLAAKEQDLLCISEIMDATHIDAFLEHVDIIQVGARNMQNFALLNVLGSYKKPVLLKRGMSATYHEFLMAAEYLVSQGNEEVILCERGIRSFENHTRNTLDLATIPVLKDLSHLPVVVDPSHGVGIRKYVPQMAMAGVAAGADGVMVEVHTHPEQSISDAKQTLSVEEFDNLVGQIKLLLPILNKSMD